MKTLNTIVGKIIPHVLRSSLNLNLEKRSYHQFRTILFTIMISIAMIPVLMAAGLSYHNYDKLLRMEEHNQLEWRLDGSIKSIEQMVESLRSVVLFAARRDRYTELIAGDNLEDLFVRLKRQYPFFADLGVIDHMGVQQSYYGPYNLLGTDYSKEKWFNQVNELGLYISRVYTGYRQVPHFAIAVSNLDPKTRLLWVLRATIDAATLQQFVNTISTNASDDLFLVDEGGTLQTSSPLYGSPLASFNQELTYKKTSAFFRGSEKFLYVAGSISNTPWSLILLKRHHIHNIEYQIFRRNLCLIVIGCMVMSAIVVFALVSFLTGMIRKADEVQLAILKDAEQRDKLASIGRLAAGVGHEINNPLAIIDQKTGLIGDLLPEMGEFEHKQVVEQSLLVINQSVERCKAITHRLLGFARRTKVQAEQVCINAILLEVLQFLENSMTYSRIKVELELQESLPSLLSDRLQLQQIFLNIINNAIDAIGKDGEISILTYLAAGDVRVVIQDNGPGIEKDALPHIFEPFYTTKETGKGTGLGLSITYGLIKKLGGDITVRSNIGIGTAFTIILPLEMKNND